MNVSGRKIEEITNQLIMLNSEDEIKSCVFLNSNTVVFSLLNHHRLFVFGNPDIDLSFATFCEQISQVNVITSDILVVKTITSVHLLIISKKQQLLIYQCLVQRFEQHDHDKTNHILCGIDTLLHDNKTLYICITRLNLGNRQKTYITLVLETIDLDTLQHEPLNKTKIYIDQLNERHIYNKIILASHEQQLFYCKQNYAAQIRQVKPDLGKKTFNIYNKELSGECQYLQRVESYLFFFAKQHIALQRIDKLNELKEQQNRYDYVFRISSNYETACAAVDPTNGTIIIGLGTYLYLIREQVLNLYTIMDLTSISYQQFHYKYPIIALYALHGRLEVIHLSKK